MVVHRDSRAELQAKMGPEPRPFYIIETTSTKTVVGATNARRTCGSDHRKQRKMADLTAAKTILEQLGGEHFVAMTGATDFVGTEDSLTFKVGSNPNHVSHVRVTQTPGDLYAVTLKGKAPQSLTRMLCHI